MRPDMKIQRGFNLVEMVVVIAITGILGAMLTMLIKGPVQDYVDTAQRAGMTDEADTAFHRLVRDVRLALPNSPRLWGSVSNSTLSCNGTETCYLEYLEMVAGGRYNTDAASCGFDKASMVGGGVICMVSMGDLVAGTTGSASNVLANGRGTIGANALLVSNSGGSCAANSVYCGFASAVILGGVVTNSGVAAADDVIYFAASTVFPSSSSNRFQIVNTPVTYECNPSAGTLTRYWDYSIPVGQPNNSAAAPLSTASSAVLASHVGSCGFSITPITDASGQSAVLVSMPLTIRRQNPGQGQSDTTTIQATAYVGSESSVYSGANGGRP